MKRKVIFIQGAGEGAHAEDARLVASLGRELGPGYSVHFPEVANEHEPDFEAWRRDLGRELVAAGEAVVVVAHSAGAALFVEWIGEERKPAPIRGLFLIGAPFFGEGGWPTDDPFPVEALETLPRGVPIHFYHGTEDEIVPFSHVDLYERAVPRAVVHRLAGRDHQLNDDLSDVARDIADMDAAGR